MNNVMLLGKYINVTKVNDQVSFINISISDKIIPVTVNDNISNTIEKYCYPNDTIGIKGTVDIKEKEIIIVAEKISFLQTKRVD